MVEIGVIDDMGEHAEIAFPIPTANAAFHLKDGGDGAAFGKYAEKSKTLELEEEWDFLYKGEVVKDFVIETGESGIWTYRKWYSGIAECWTFTQIQINV